MDGNTDGDIKTSLHSLIMTWCELVLMQCVASVRLSASVFTPRFQ